MSHSPAIGRPVTSLIVQAFAEANRQRPDLWERWIAISHVIGGLLPNSLLAVSVQRLGTLDRLLRCMETEHTPPLPQGDPFGDSIDFHINLSEIWIGQAYEILRVIDVRLMTDISVVDIRNLHNDLRMIRIPLEKYEIAREGKRKLLFKRVPPLEHDKGDFVYDPKDQSRAHIMPTGISQRGSVIWHVIDTNKEESRWIERQGIADRLLNIGDALRSARSIEG